MRFTLPMTPAVSGAPAAPADMWQGFGTEQQDQPIEWLRKVYQARVAICEACPHRVQSDCRPCGWGRCAHPSVTFTTQPKPTDPESRCPELKWERLES